MRDPQEWGEAIAVMNGHEGASAKVLGKAIADALRQAVAEEREACVAECDRLAVLCHTSEMPYESFAQEQGRDQFGQGLSYAAEAVRERE
jgi:hypothetical protein